MKRTVLALTLASGLMLNALARMPTIIDQNGNVVGLIYDPNGEQPQQPQIGNHFSDDDYSLPKHRL